MRDLSRRIIELESKRFLVRTLKSTDASERYRSWFDDPTIQKYIVSSENPPTIEELSKYISDKNLQSDAVFFGVFCKVNDLHLGNIKYEPVCKKSKSAVMGILVGDIEWRGKGLAGEVLELTCQWLAKNQGIKEVYLGVQKTNLAAIKAYERGGFCVTKNHPLFAVDDSSLAMKKQIGIP